MHLKALANQHSLEHINSHIFNRHYGSDGDAPSHPDRAGAEMHSICGDGSFGRDQRGDAMRCDGAASNRLCVEVVSSLSPSHSSSPVT